MHSKVGTCLQVGLMDNQELMYLVADDVERAMHGVSMDFWLPAEVLERYESWRYFGMDADPISIASKLKEFEPSEQVSWIQGTLGNANHPLPGLTASASAESRLAYMPSWLSIMDATVEKPRWVYTLKVGLSELLAALSVEHLSVLWLDIEGSELSVIEAFDGSVLPDYFAVEVHCYPEPVTEQLLAERVRFVKRNLLPHGYRCRVDRRSNFREGQYMTHDLQFMRSDLWQA